MVQYCRLVKWCTGHQWFNCSTRNLPWKIMIMQRQTQTNDRNTKSVGYFLQVGSLAEVLVLVLELVVVVVLLLVLQAVTPPHSATASLSPRPGPATPPPTCASSTRGTAPSSPGRSPTSSTGDHHPPDQLSNLIT